MNKLYEYMNKIDDKKSLKESTFRMTPELWAEIKAYADNPKTTGRRFAYEGNYDYEVKRMFGHAIDVYNKRNNDTLEYNVNTSGGYGNAELQRKDGSYVEFDFMWDCDNVLDIARNSNTYKEFMQGLYNYIAELAKHIAG